MAEQMVQLSYIRPYWFPTCLAFMPSLPEVDHRAGALHNSPSLPNLSSQLQSKAKEAFRRVIFNNDKRLG